LARELGFAPIREQVREVLAAAGRGEKHHHRLRPATKKVEGIPMCNGMHHLMFSVDQRISISAAAT